MAIVLYTQPKCSYCDMMKGMLTDAGISFYTLDISAHPHAKNFLKRQGHKTVPQLYVENIHINKNSTDQYTPEQLAALIDQAKTSNDLVPTEDHVVWPWADSGIESSR